MIIAAHCPISYRLFVSNRQKMASPFRPPDGRKKKIILNEFDRPFKNAFRSCLVVTQGPKSRSMKNPVPPSFPLLPSLFFPPSPSLSCPPSPSLLFLPSLSLPPFLPLPSAELIFVVTQGPKLKKIKIFEKHAENMKK